MYFILSLLCVLQFSLKLTPVTLSCYFPASDLSYPFLRKMFYQMSSLKGISIEEFCLTKKNLSFYIWGHYVGRANLVIIYASLKNPSVLMSPQKTLMSTWKKAKGQNKGMCLSALLSFWSWIFSDLLLTEKDKAAWVGGCHGAFPK